MKRICPNIIIALAVFFFLSTEVSLAGQVTLIWDPPDIFQDVTGYMIHYGTVTGTYSQSVDVGNTTNYTLSNLTDRQAYYFAVTAYNASGYQSVYSNEVSYLSFGYVPPGSYKDLTVEVMNNGMGTMTGIVNASPPFSIISGGSYSLTPGQTQQVVVRYTAPLQEGSQTGSLIFTGGGGITIQVKGTSKKVGLPWLMLLLD
jgi:hypothetical protein